MQYEQKLLQPYIIGTDALNVPFFILRAISDSADMDAGFDFDEFLKSSAKNSADYLMKIVEELIK